MGLNTIHIDFADRRRGSLPGIVLLIAGMACAGWSAANFIDADERQARAESRLARLTRKLEGAPRRVSVEPEIRRLFAGAVRVQGELQRPWDQLFRDVESAVDASVALLGFEPDVGKRQLRLVAEAKNLDDALAFAARLESTPSLAGVHLTQQEQRQSDGVPAIGFGVVADWNPQP